MSATKVGSCSFICVSSNNQASSSERENQRIMGVHIFRDNLTGRILRKRASSLQAIYQVSIVNKFTEDDKPPLTRSTESSKRKVSACRSEKYSVVEKR